MGVFLVTGASGFVGRALCARLEAQGVPWRPVVRRSDPAFTHGLMMQIDPEANWRPFLADVDCIIHLAARVHVQQDTLADPLLAYRQQNVAATLRLAQQAARAGVKRFVYLSSVKVHGEATLGRPFMAEDSPQPQDPYGISKWEAEQALTALAQETGLELVIIRPPLVYGPGVKANFLQLMRLVARGWPLPLGSVHNRRSMVYLGNLVDLIWHCCHMPEAVGRTFLVSDGVDVSTAQLVRALAGAMGRRARLLPCPPSVLYWGTALAGRRGVAERLLGSLQVDITATEHCLGWQPPVSFDDGIAATVAAFQPTMKKL